MEGKTTSSTSENACIYGSFRHIGGRWKVICKKSWEKTCKSTKNFVTLQLERREAAHARPKMRASWRSLNRSIARKREF